MNQTIDIPEITEAQAAVATAAPASMAVPRLSDRLGDYLELTKPRMNFLVVVTTMVGFYLARGAGDWVLLLNTIVGTWMTAASAAVLNQLIERRYDALMPRTRNRPLPAGRIQPAQALTFGMVLGVGGVAYLSLGVNLLTAALGLGTLLGYLLLYTPLKRVTTLNTVIGAVPGAIPPVMGFAAVENTIPTQAWLLFAILFLWQMPHFLAIAIMYRDDYAAGGFRMLPVVDRSLHLTGRMIILYTLALIPVTLLAFPLRMSGAVYVIVAAALGIAFLAFGINAMRSRSRVDARRLFFASVIYLPLLLAAMMIDKT